MNTTAILVSLPLIMIAFFFMSKVGNKKNNNTEEGYFLANRNVKFFGLCLTFLATQLGGGVILGTAEAAYENGLYALFYALGLSLGLIALSVGIGSKLRKFEINTIPELFSKQCNSLFLRKLSSIILITTMFLILTALSVGVRKFLCSLGLENDLYFVLIWCAVIAYTSLGGLSTVVKTDAIQISFVLGTFIITAISILASDTPLPSLETVKALTVQGEGIQWKNWILMPLLFVIIGQDMGQRCFAAKCPRTVSLATFTAAILLFISSLVPLMLGIMARTNNIDFNQSKLLTTVEQLTSPFVATMFALAVFFAIVSTADSLLCAISSNIRYDLRQKSSVRSSQLMTAMVGTAAVLLSLTFDNIIPVMIKGYELSVTCLALPILICIITPYPNRAGITGVMFTGILGYLVEYMTAVDLFLPTVACATLVYLVISSLTKKTQITLESN